MVKNVASVVADLDPEDFYLLSGVEQGMRFSEWVNRGKLPEYANLTREDGRAFLDVAPRVPVRTEVHRYPLNEANQALEGLRQGRFAGAAVLTPN